MSMQNMNKNKSFLNIDQLIDRVKLFLNQNSDISLSKKLEKTNNYIAKSRMGKTIDLDLLISHCPDADFNWLLTGEKNSIKSIADIDSKGNRIELKTFVRVLDQSGLQGLLKSYKEELANVNSLIEDETNKIPLNIFTDNNSASETIQQLRETLDKRNSQIAELIDKLFELEKLVAEYQLREKKQ